MRTSQGLTVVEVMVAIAILGTVMAILMTSSVSSMRHNVVSGQRTQAAQILNYIGRRVVDGDAAVLPEQDQREWGYGELRVAFTELMRQGGFRETDAYRAEIERDGQFQLASASATRYVITVCWRQEGGEHCVRGEIGGPGSPPASGGSPPLPGIN